MHHHFGKQRQRGLQPIPDPHRQPLAGRILQSLDVIEIVMIELFVERLKHRFDIAEIHHPARLRAHIAGQMQLDPERMPMQPRAFVALRHVGQAVGCFESEYFEDVHRSIVQPAGKPPGIGRKTTPPASLRRNDLTNRGQLPPEDMADGTQEEIAGAKKVGHLGYARSAIDFRDLQRGVWWLWVDSKKA